MGDKLKVVDIDTLSNTTEMIEFKVVRNISMPCYPEESMSYMPMLLDGDVPIAP